MTCVVVYIYTVLAFNFFRKFYETEGAMGPKCNSMITVSGGDAFCGTFWPVPHRHHAIGFGFLVWCVINWLCVYTRGLCISLFKAILIRPCQPRLLIAENLVPSLQCCTSLSKTNLFSRRWIWVCPLIFSLILLLGVSAVFRLPHSCWSAIGRRHRRQSSWSGRRWQRTPENGLRHHILLLRHHYPACHHSRWVFALSGCCTPSLLKKLWYTSCKI